MEQRTLNSQILDMCPGEVQRYYNTPSAFLGPRDYFPNYDDLAEIKERWDPQEVFRIYQGVRPTGKAPDAYEFKRRYVLAPDPIPSPIPNLIPDHIPIPVPVPIPIPIHNPIPIHSPIHNTLTLGTSVSALSTIGQWKNHGI